MKYFVIFLLSFTIHSSLAQTTNSLQKVAGIVINDITQELLYNVNIININSVKGTISDKNGHFEIEAMPGDTLNISIIGFQSIKVKVTNDWIKAKSIKIHLTEKAYSLEEVVVGKYDLTGYLEIDSKLIPIKENYRYSISGLAQGYEAGEYSPNAFGKVIGSIFNPADLLYNFFGKKPKELKKLKEMKKDDTVKNLLETKYDRESIALFLGIDKNEIPKILQRCNYSESFANTANDLQVIDAINSCYEEYKILKQK